MALYAEDEEERGGAGQTDGRMVRYSFCDANGPRTVPMETLLPGTPQDWGGASSSRDRGAERSSDRDRVANGSGRRG